MLCFRPLNISLHIIKIVEASKKVFTDERIPVYLANSIILCVFFLTAGCRRCQCHFRGPAEDQQVCQEHKSNDRVKKRNWVKEGEQPENKHNAFVYSRLIFARFCPPSHVDHLTFSVPYDQNQQRRIYLYHFMYIAEVRIPCVTCGPLQLNAICFKTAGQNSCMYIWSLKIKSSRN